MKQSVERNIEPRKPIAVIRLTNLEQAIYISRALLAGGITIQEFALTNPKALEAITQVRRQLSGEVLVGAGTVLDAGSALACIQAGAQFLVTPTFIPEVITAGHSQGIKVLCGAFTPTEIFNAWQAAADLVKVFPAGQLGPGYIKDVLGPLPDIPLVPTGGVNLSNCAAFFAAGAYTVAIGSNLVNNEITQKKDWTSLTELARRFVEACI